MRKILFVVCLLVLTGSIASQICKQIIIKHIEKKHSQATLDGWATWRIKNPDWKPKHISVDDAIRELNIECKEQPLLPFESTDLIDNPQIEIPGFAFGREPGATPEVADVIPPTELPFIPPLILSPSYIATIPPVGSNVPEGSTFVLMLIGVIMIVFYSCNRRLCSVTVDGIVVADVHRLPLEMSKWHSRFSDYMRTYNG